MCLNRTSEPILAPAPAESILNHDLPKLTHLGLTVLYPKKRSQCITRFRLSNQTLTRLKHVSLQGVAFSGIDHPLMAVTHLSMTVAVTAYDYTPGADFWRLPRACPQLESLTLGLDGPKDERTSNDMSRNFHLLSAPKEPLTLRNLTHLYIRSMCVSLNRCTNLVTCPVVEKVTLRGPYFSSWDGERVVRGEFLKRACANAKEWIFVSKKGEERPLPLKRN